MAIQGSAVAMVSARRFDRDASLAAIIAVFGNASPARRMAFFLVLRGNDDGVAG